MVKSTALKLSERKVASLVGQVARLFVVLVEKYDAGGFVLRLRPFHALSVRRGPAKQNTWTWGAAGWEPFETTPWLGTL